MVARAPLAVTPAMAGRAETVRPGLMVLLPRIFNGSAAPVATVARAVSGVRVVPAGLREVWARRRVRMRSAALAVAVRPRLVAHGSLVRPAPQVLPQRMFAGEPQQVSAGPLGCSRGNAGPDWE